MKDRAQTALLLFVTPLIVLAVDLVLYLGLNHVFNNLIDSGEPGRLLGFLAVVAALLGSMGVLLLVVGWPICLYFLVTINKES